MVEHLEKPSDVLKGFSSYANKHNCPNWAKEIWYNNNYLKISKLFPILNIKEVRDNYDCVISQVVAEWLELDQIEDMDTDCALIQFFGDRKVYAYVGGSSVGYVEYKIRFFGDEV